MKEILDGYRCPCGKLLLKGFIFAGEVEIKCRACKRTTVITGVSGNLSNDFQYLLLTYPDGTICSASPSASVLLGYEAKELDKKHISGIFETFTRGFLEKTAKKLEDESKKALVVKVVEKHKSGAESQVQVGIRPFISLSTERLLVFDINRKKPEVPRLLRTKKKA